MDFATKYVTDRIRERLVEAEARLDNCREAGRLMVDALQLVRKKSKKTDNMMLVLYDMINIQSEMIKGLDARIVELEEMHACTDRQPFTWSECDMPDPLEDLEDELPDGALEAAGDEAGGCPPCMRCEDDCMECEYAADCPMMEAITKKEMKDSCSECVCLDVCLDNLDI